MARLVVSVCFTVLLFSFVSTRLLCFIGLLGLEQVSCSALTCCVGTCPVLRVGVCKGDQLELPEMQQPGAV